MVSAIMNNHIANFLVGIEKGGSTIRSVESCSHGQVRLAHGAS